MPAQVYNKGISGFFSLTMSSRTLTLWLSGVSYTRYQMIHRLILLEIVIYERPDDSPINIIENHNDRTAYFTLWVIAQLLCEGPSSPQQRKQHGKENTKHNLFSTKTMTSRTTQVKNVTTNDSRWPRWEASSWEAEASALANRTSPIQHTMDQRLV
jgi:hypothetical protein